MICSKKHTPNYAEMHQWELYGHDFLFEHRQLLEEGHDVEKYKKLVDEIVALPAGQLREELAETLGAQMHNEHVSEDYPFIEPSDFEGIQAARKASEITFNKPENKAVLFGKIKGSWLGRAAGCLLGKPLECVYIKDIHHLLKESGNFPMYRYVNKSDFTDELEKGLSWPLSHKTGWADTVERMPVDDDTNYTVMAAEKLLKEHGRDFKPMDVAKTWISCQPKDAYCTAERIAFVNFIKGYYPPDCATYKNPYREWIGAQIRADYFGYINPGDPETAAEMAWRDACISHVKNGIYGEMFVAAMIACAAVCDDIVNVIRGGIAQIPEKSRLYCQTAELLEMYENGKTENECIDWIYNLYEEDLPHHWTHTISNALIVVVSLLFGEKDFGKTVCLAVQCGFDTDCNGATAGSIIGMLLGARGISEDWTKPLNGEIETSIFGVGIAKIDVLAETTMQHLPEDLILT